MCIDGCILASNGCTPPPRLFGQLLAALWVGHRWGELPMQLSLTHRHDNQLVLVLHGLVKLLDEADRRPACGSAYKGRGRQGRRAGQASSRRLTVGGGRWERLERHCSPCLHEQQAAWETCRGREMHPMQGPPHSGRHACKRTRAEHNNSLLAAAAARRLLSKHGQPGVGDRHR